MNQSRLLNRKILIGVCGGIAAYKVAELVSSLKKGGAEVRVMMTQSALEFVGSVTFEGLSGYQVHTSIFPSDANPSEQAMAHISLARWADVFLIAPATANMIGKLANGIADDLISSTYLATTARIAIAPAMNTQMWLSSSVKRNISQLEADGVQIWGPDSGLLACEEVGEGRMLEPADLLSRLSAFYPQAKQGTPLHWVITAGPTQEPLDPVRYITNHSSGKMGYALAQEALNRGDKVTLISGQCAISPPVGATFNSVQTAAQMHEAAMGSISDADIFIGCAAVCDYAPLSSQPQKIKKDNPQMVIELAKTKDIIASVAVQETRPFVVGFAAETNNVLEYARQKRQNKRLDAIVANEVGQSKGFNVNTNAATFISTNGEVTFKEQSKQSLALNLIQQIVSEYETKHSS